MEVILLEKLANLGALGDVVKVKSGFARNYLIPHGKARRATPESIAEFEARRAELEKILGRSTNDVSALLQVALIEEAEKRHPEARKLYERILSISPNQKEALNNLAYLLAEELNEPGKALELARR